jgi:hypothetical protein
MQYIANETEKQNLKETYVSKITFLLDRCIDISLLDLIVRLLEKSL